jgi:hypothetical protein
MKQLRPSGAEGAACNTAAASEGARHADCSLGNLDHGISGSAVFSARARVSTARVRRRSGRCGVFRFFVRHLWT